MTHIITPPIGSVINQITQRLTRGNIPDTADQLLYTPIEVLRVGLKADTADYIEDTDYSIIESSLSWALSGTEPSPGQAYYITYKYNPTQFIKDFDTIAAELKNDYNTVLPSLDVSKSAARDLFINVPSKQFVDQYNAIRHIYLIQSLQNVDEITTSELDAIGVNYSKPRLPATKSSDTVKFFLNIAKGTPINIPAGTRVGTQPSLTNNQQITFVTTETKTILAGDMYVLVSVQADTAGVTGNVGAETVKIMIDNVGADGVINPIASTGGSDQEANADYAKRLIDVFKSRNIGTVNGIKGLVQTQPNVIDVYVADFGDPIMVRDGGLGGKADVYIQAESGFEGLFIDESFTFDGTEYKFDLQPVLSITEVKVNGVVLAPANYSLVKDIGILQNSTQASDKLYISSGAVVGDSILVSYIYNKLFNDIQTLLYNDNYHVAGIDVLSRGATESFIDVTATIKIKTGYVFGDIKASIITQITNYIEAKEIGSQIVYGDIINIVHDTAGVADLLPIQRLSRQTEFTSGTIQLRGNEFPRAGTILITQML